jgi:hypothetical protein
MVRLTSLSHIVAFLPLLINQFVSGESYNTRLLHDGSRDICRVHNTIHNRKSSSTSIKKIKYDDVDETEVGFPSFSATTPRRRNNAAPINSCSSSALVMSLLRGGAASFNPFPSGYHPFGYGITNLGRSFLEFDGSIDSDVGKFLSTFKGGAGGDGGGGGSKRKSTATMKDQWLEIVRVAKTGQSMRIYRRLDEIVDFCLKAGFLD